MGTEDTARKRTSWGEDGWRQLSRNWLRAGEQVPTKATQCRNILALRSSPRTFSVPRHLH